MSAPYSDNLYSTGYDDSDNENALAAPYSSHAPAEPVGQEDGSALDEDALSPTDGYFHASQDQSPNPLDTSSSSSGLDYSGGPQRTPYVPNVLVEDPSLRNNDKAREAEQERLNNQSSAHTPSPYTHLPAAATGPSAASQYTSASSRAPTSPTHHHRRSVEEYEPHRFPSGQPTASASASQTYGTTSPVANPSRPSAFSRDHGEAPPAYSPSPTSPGNSPEGGYQTFAPATSSADMGAPSERAPLLPREPQSMGGPHDGSNETRWQRFKGAIAGSDLRKKLKSILGVLVILSILVMVFSGFTMYPSDGHKDLDLGRDMPEKKPTSGSPPEFEWKPSGSCLDSPHAFPKKIQNFDVGSSNILELTQIIAPTYGGNYQTPSVSGEAFLRVAPDGSQGSLEVEVISNDPELEVSYEFIGNSFKIITPKISDWSNSRRPCLQIRATLWVPKDAEVNSFKVNTVHLDVTVTDGFSINAAADVDLGSVSGDVILPRHKEGDYDVEALYHLKSRDTYIHTISGDVSGVLALYDSVRIDTASGDVTTYVIPKDADASDVKPAELIINTISGTIKVKEPIADAESSEQARKLPARDYRVQLGSKSGSVWASLAISSWANIYSLSGDLHLKLWPVLDASELEEGSGKPAFKTETTSGDHKVQLHEPIWTSIAKKHLKTTPETAPRGPTGNDEPLIIIHPHDILPIPPSLSAKNAGGDEDEGPYLEHYFSTHASVSGKISLRYPSVWVGTLHATTITGSQKIRGDGLDVVTRRKQVTGRKGKGHSQIDINTVSGDQDALIGKED